MGFRLEPHKRFVLKRNFLGKPKAFIEEPCEGSKLYGVVRYDGMAGEFY